MLLHPEISDFFSQHDLQEKGTNYPTREEQAVVSYVKQSIYPKMMICAAKRKMSGKGTRTKDFKQRV